MTAAYLLVRSPACSARQLQTCIVQVVHLCPTGFRKEPCERLERHKPKGLRVVLRGLGSSNAPRLPGGVVAATSPSYPTPRGAIPWGHPAWNSCPRNSCGSGSWLSPSPHSIPPAPTRNAGSMAP